MKRGGHARSHHKGIFLELSDDGVSLIVSEYLNLFLCAAQLSKLANGGLVMLTPILNLCLGSEIESVLQEKG